MEVEKKHDSSDVTAMIAAACEGSEEAARGLFSCLYEELRGVAARALRSERDDHTLQATALVHEVYLKLIGRRELPFRDRAHFLSVASQAIRRILVDHARKHSSKKRGGSWRKLPLDAVSIPTPSGDLDLVSLDEALSSLAKSMPRKARVVEMRFFGGASLSDVADVLGITPRTVERDWRFARAWLYRELDGPAMPGDGVEPDGA